MPRLQQRFDFDSTAVRQLIKTKMINVTVTNPNSRDLADLLIYLGCNIAAHAPVDRRMVVARSIFSRVESRIVVVNTVYGSEGLHGSTFRAHPRGCRCGVHCSHIVEGIRCSVTVTCVNWWLYSRPFRAYCALYHCTHNTALESLK